MNAVICMIKGLLFDFDDTIGNRVQYSYQAYAYLLDSYCSFDDPYEREAVLQDCMLWDMKGNFSKEFVLENLRKKYHLSLPIQSLWPWWVENQYRFTCPLDDAKMVLETLHAKYQLALVTNGNDQAQRNKVAQIGFEKYFDVIVTSEQAGKKKPAPNVYALALEKLRLKKEEVIFVGDTFSTDIIGAHRFGMDAIWLNSQSMPCSLTDIKMIHALRDLLEIV